MPTEIGSLDLEACQTAVNVAMICSGITVGGVCTFNLQGGGKGDDQKAERRYPLQDTDPCHGTAPVLY